MEQLELFEHKKDIKREVIREKDYVYIKHDPSHSNVIPFDSLKQGYVTKIENIENQKVCHVFFGNRMVKYFDYQLTKNNENKG